MCSFLLILLLLTDSEWAEDAVDTHMPCAGVPVTCIESWHSIHAEPKNLLQHRTFVTMSVTADYGLETELTPEHVNATHDENSHLSIAGLSMAISVISNKIQI